MLEKKFWNKNFGKKFWKKNFEIKNFEEKIWKKILIKLWKKNFWKKFWQKDFGKINYKAKIFITEIYSNIDKCHTFFLVSTLRQNSAKDRKNVCGIRFKIGSVARSDWTQGIWRFERSREKRYITACELSVTYHMSDISSSVVRNFSSACPHDKARTIECHKKVECCASAVVRCRIHRC